MVTAEGRGKQDSWVLLLFLLTLGELFQHPETQLLHLKNKKVTVRQNYSLCPEIPEEIQVLSLSCSQCWGGILQWRLCPGTHGAGAQKLVFSFTKWKGWSDEFAKKSSSFASANPLLLTVLFLFHQSLLCWHMRVPYGHMFHTLYPLSRAEKGFEVQWGSWEALTSCCWTQRLVWGVRMKLHCPDAHCMSSSSF